MKTELREKMNLYDKSEAYDSSDEVIREILCEENSIRENDHEEHRWYTTFRRVIKINDMYISFYTYTNSGDEAALEDSEWTKMVIDSAMEVIPKEVTTIDYIPKEK